MILINIGEHVNEMMAVAAHFLIIRQNINMATNAILYCGLTPIALFWALKVHSNTIVFTNIRAFCT